MKEKTRKIFIMIVMAALIVSLMAASFAALTYGRYSGGKFDENSPYDDYIDFVGATAYEVRTPEQFVNAINNGYSYIKIAADAEEPFVVNDDIANVTTNLVLDVNGTTVIRNSRNPLLDVKRSVSVVLVYDSSTEQAGGFYNPVGSALQTSGGTLTVGAGVYESGPNEEYQTESYQTGQQVTLFTRTDRTGPYPETGASVKDLPILTGKNVGTPEDPVSVYDYYFEIAPEGNVNPLIEDDTYLIYTKESNCYEKDGQLLVNCTKTETEAGTEISGTSFSVESNVASCDFYYYYPVNGTAGTADAFQEYAVVYGYHDVKALARDEKKTDENCTEYGMASALTGSGLVWPYAAIRSEAGNTFARGGVFKTHFGEKNTYCIYSAGGTMTVGGTAEPTFSAVQSGVCIKMVGQETEDSLTIDSGDFSSQIGDTIQMEGGKMEVKQGKFTKTGCKKGTDAQLENQTAIISLTGGTLNVSGTKTDDTYSVTMTAGGTGNGGALENVFGIRADDGGAITTKGVSFHIYGDYSAGVLSYNGTINLGNDTAITVTETHPEGKITSAGVSSEQSTEEAKEGEKKEEHPVNLFGKNVSINSNGLGITARGVVNVGREQESVGGNVTVPKIEADVTVTALSGTGIYVNNGEFNVFDGSVINIESKVSTNYTWATPPKTTTTDPSEGSTTNTPNIYNGVYVQGGSLKSEGALNVTFTGVENDDQTSHNDDSLIASITNNPTEDEYLVNKDIYDRANQAINDNIDSNLYQNFQTKSYAVRVEASTGTTAEVTITAGNITNSVGGGILVNGGTVKLGTTGEGAYDENTKKGFTVQTTGTALQDQLTTDDGSSNKYYIASTRVEDGWFGNTYYVTLSRYIPLGSGTVSSTWSFAQPLTGGDAVKVVGGTLEVSGGHYEAAQGNGIFVSGAVTAEEGKKAVNISGGTFLGYNAGYVNREVTGPAGSYGIKIIGGSVAIEDGTFGAGRGTSNGAAFFMGTAEQTADIDITGGQYYSYNTDAVSTFRYIDLDMSNATVETTVDGNSTARAAISVQNDEVYTDVDGRGADITITSGTYSSTNGYGLWYGAGVDKVAIKDGTFTGQNSSGLYFYVQPNDSNVQLSGGTYNGNPEEHGLVNHWYGKGAIGAEVSGSSYPLRGGNGFEIKLNNILGNGSSIIESGSGKTYSRNNDALCDTVSSEEWVKIG